MSVIVLIVCAGDGQSMARSLTVPPQGSGKTLAFGLPIIQQLLADGGGEAAGHSPRSRMPPSPLRALILLPTRELALQVIVHAITSF